MHISTLTGSGGPMIRESAVSMEDLFTILFQLFRLWGVPMDNNSATETRSDEEVIATCSQLDPRPLLIVAEWHWALQSSAILPVSQARLTIMIAEALMSARLFADFEVTGHMVRVPTVTLLSSTGYLRLCELIEQARVVTRSHERDRKAVYFSAVQIEAVAIGEGVVPGEDTAANSFILPYGTPSGDDRRAAA